MIVWYEFHCYSCKADNLVYGGDPDDCSFFDDEGFKCRKCGKNNDIDQEDGTTSESENEYSFADFSPRDSEQEISRLKSGDFTEEEFQNLCHKFTEDDACRFRAGCEEYQRKLFGSK